MQLPRLAAFVGLIAVSQACHIEVVGVDDWDDSNRVEVSAVTSRVLGVEAQTGLHIIGLNGAIEILGDAGAQEVSVYAVKKVRSDTRQDAEAHLSRLQVSVRADPTEFVVRTHQPEHTNGRDYQVDYQITVPWDFMVRARNANGWVRIENLRADAQVENANGNVVIRNQRGSSWVTVGNGEIDAHVNLPDGGQIVHAVGNGWVKLELPSQVSAQFGAQVGNGSINISGLTLTNSVSGPHILQGTLGSGKGIIDLTVGNGWVQVQGG
jgi:hypothetical protein